MRVQTTLQWKPQRASCRRALDEFLRTVVEHLSADMGTIHLIDERDGLLHLRAAVGTIPEEVRKLIEVIPVGKGIAGQAAEQRKPVSICNIQQDTSGVTRPGAKIIGTQGALCVPLIARKRLVGTLGIGCNRERTFTEEETKRLMKHARQLAKALSL